MSILQSPADPPVTDHFTAEELENSFPLDVGRRFRDRVGRALVDTVLDGMRAGEVRVRRRRASADSRERASVEVLLANLAAASLNVVDADRFVAVGFNRNDYTGTELSAEAMRLCREYLEAEGLIEGVSGFQRWDSLGDGKFSRRTRVRATDRLRDWFDELEVSRKSFSIPASQLIRIRAAGSRATPLPPDDVEASRAILERINRRLSSLEIGLDGDAHSVLTSWRVDDEGEHGPEKERKRRYAGDFTAVSLYRSFKGGWTSGGRLYGGWWMSVPRTLRPYITIDGSETVELDYRALHPCLLFHREGLPLDFDPYSVPGLGGNVARELGKRTFNRMLNRDKPRTSQRAKFRAANGDLEVLPHGMTFAQYRSAMQANLRPIQHWFGTGEGVRLQRVDSDLALSVLDTLEEASIPLLPIHDSFIVPVQHEDLLRETMEATFLDQHGFLPRISIKARPGASPGGHPNP